ncbi:MAG: amino acid permease [Candidatus Palauibacterales bacterium]|nr:amino acid permease [Candidatus Palauibacterales bacterium]
MTTANVEASPRSHAGLHRILRVREGLAVTVGIVIGAGILRTPGLIAGYLGDAWQILGVWVLGGVVAGMSTVLLAEMAAAFPQAGGKYVYAREAFGPVAGFVAGWSELLVTRAFSGAAKAVVIAEYIILLIGRGSVPLLAGVVVLGFVLVHFGGLRVGTLFQNVTTAVKVAILAAIAVAGIWAGAGDFRGFAPSASFAPEYSAFLGFALAYQAVAFAYYGWEDAAKMAEETRDPGRALPRILLGGAAAVVVIYLMINVAFLSSLTPTEMAGSPLVAQDAVRGVFGATAGTIVVLAGLLILVSSLNVQFLGMPRVAFALARNGLAPQAFSRVTARGTPGSALLFISAVILVLALTGAFEWLIRFMMLVAISVDLMVLLSFFRLRKTRPEVARPFAVPGSPWFPSLTILLYVILLAIIVGTQPGLTLGAGAMLGALLLAGFFTARRQSRQA